MACSDRCKQTWVAVSESLLDRRLPQTRPCLCNGGAWDMEFGADRAMRLSLLPDWCLQSVDVPSSVLRRPSIPFRVHDDQILIFHVGACTPCHRRRWDELGGSLWRQWPRAPQKGWVRGGAAEGPLVSECRAARDCGEDFGDACRDGCVLRLPLGPPLEGLRRIHAQRENTGRPEATAGRVALGRWRRQTWSVHRSFHLRLGFAHLN